MNLSSNLAQYRYDPHTPKISNIYCKAPEHCVQLQWFCDSGHLHKISIDITPAISGYDALVHADIASQFSKCSQGPFRAIPESITSQDWTYGSSDWALSSCFYDIVVFKQLDVVSRNIQSVYRCFKQIAHNLLPKLLVRDKKHSISGNHIIDVIHSYALKCLLFAEVKEHHSAKDWDTAHANDRLTGLLQTLKEWKVGDVWTLSKDIFTQQDVTVSIPGGFEQPLCDAGVSSDIEELIEYLSTGDDFLNKTNLSPDISSDVNGPMVLNCATSSCTDAQNPAFKLVYRLDMIPQSPPQPHPVTMWCRNKIKRKFHDAFTGKSSDIKARQTPKKAKLKQIE